LIMPKVRRSTFEAKMSILICAEKPLRTTALVKETGLTYTSFYLNAQKLIDKKLLINITQQYNRRWNRRLWQTSDKGKEAIELWKQLRKFV